MDDRVMLKIGIKILTNLTRRGIDKLNFRERRGND